jgi:hypothetical protein
MKQEVELRSTLDMKTRELQLDPLSQVLQDEVNKLRSNLAEFEARKLEGQKVRSRAKWCLFGDKLTAEFFRAVRETPNNSSITELKDSQGNIQHDREALETICTDYYSQLYTQVDETPQALLDRASILDCVTCRFTPQMVQQLEEPLTKQELHVALLQMAKALSPGPDGISTEFYYRFWDLIGDEFTEMVLCSIFQGHLPGGMTSVTIALLFKSGDRTDLSNWRPITLLNVSYKVVAKSLQIRLQKLLKDVIG